MELAEIKNDAHPLHQRVVEVLDRELILDRITIRVRENCLNYKEGDKVYFKPWEVLPLKPAELPRSVLMDLVWRDTHGAFKGVINGIRYILDLSVKYGTCSVPLDSLTDAELFDKLPSKTRKIYE